MKIIVHQNQKKNPTKNGFSLSYHNNRCSTGWIRNSSNRPNLPKSGGVYMMVGGFRSKETNRQPEKETYRSDRQDNITKGQPTKYLIPSIRDSSTPNNGLLSDSDPFWPRLIQRAHIAYWERRRLFLRLLWWSRYSRTYDILLYNMGRNKTNIACTEPPRLKPRNYDKRNSTKRGKVIHHIIRK